MEISIHAPRVGSDSLSFFRSSSCFYFNPRSPCGERPSGTVEGSTASIFQSTLPVWGATVRR